MFSPRVARRSLERYRRRGLDRLERQMVAAASAGGLAGVRVIEIGGGIGTLQAELLEAGAEQGEIVELVPAYEPFARELAREKGLDARVSFRVEDVLGSPEAVEPGDVVLLNRVVCCSRDGVELAGAAARLARRTLVLSFPRDRLLMRVGLGAMNVFLALFRRSFRVFAHRRRTLLAAAQAEGLELVAGERGFAWEFVALRRPAYP
jgi:magnesium-protoporphyrin O-methyltransferase